MDEDSSNIKCGCGFSAVGPDQKVNLEAFDAHRCPEEDREARTWYGALFSLEGVITLVVVGWVIVEIIKALK